jgi:heme exporter protein A
VSALLSLKDVTLRRGGRLLFERLSLTLEAGEALQLRGPNGSGKSSLLRLAAGLLRAEHGTVECSTPALADENLALDRELSLRTALGLWAPYAAVDRALDIMGIADLAKIPVRFLSTGQARKASLARLLASEAPLWLLDEPVNGLDVDGSERLAQAIESHRRNGGTVVAASHQPLPGDWLAMELSA